MNVIVKEHQRAFEKSAEGTPDKTPGICGYYGRACRRMGSIANSMLCLRCPLALYVDTCKESVSGEIAASKNICRSCSHNLNPHGLDCEFACVGVTKVEEDGFIVVSCDDYEHVMQDEQTLQNDGSLSQNDGIQNA